ncbi:O-antigen ligase family protein [Flavitalea sp. BT771]|uniref:O-antigen ligase family protein n=1 Tax=Flavitalea sp. BT771 TaxID=3063329 RepID=UPI0026E44992|nr:O-antigen ligase family protein [Flavitalea sp. BT771]MDO6432304.1 O-antigen ligase family protein [Flavitalea sp. BT771]MDV6221214.1 O-antigen ligase family protein [Flavitalea sp. BT771]
MKKINTAFLLLILISPCVHFIAFDPRVLDWQVVYIQSIILLFSIFTFSHLLTKKITIVLTPADYIVFFFILVSFLRLIFTDYFSPKNETLLNLLLFLILYISLRSIEIKLIENIINFAFPAAGLLFSLYGMLQFSGILKYNNPFFKMGGPFANPSMFANFLCLTIPFSIINIYKSCIEKGVLFRILMITSASFSFVVVLLGLERSSLVGIVVGLIIIAAGKITMSNPSGFFSLLSNGKKTAIVITIAAAGMLALYLLRPTSAHGRILIYQNTLTLIKDYPLFGIGPGKFPAVYPLYQSNYFNALQQSTSDQLVADNVQVAFNEYLQIVAELGLPGLILIVLGLSYWIKLVKKTYNSYQPSVSPPVIASLSSIAAVAIFSYPFRDFVILSYVVILISAVRPRDEKSVEYTLTPLVRNGVLSTLLVIAMGTGIINSYLTNAQYKWEILALSQEDSDKKLKKYNEIYSTLDNNGRFLYNYGVELSTDNDYMQSLTMLEKAGKYFTNTDLLVYLGDDYLGIKNYEKAKEYYMKAVTMVPKKFLPKYALMQYYQTIHNKRSADSLAEKILTAKIIYPSAEIYTIKGQALELLKDCNQ